ncbi:MAG: ATP-binding protein [Bacilli bacterium]
MLTELGLYKIIFTLQILIAMVLFSFKRMKLKKHGVIRILISSIICLFLAFLFPLFKDISYSWWYSSLMFFILFCFCFVSMVFIYDESLQKIFFIAIASYTAQHLSYQFYNLLITVIDIDYLTSSSQYSSNPVTYSSLQVSLILFSVMLVVYVTVYEIINEFFIEKICSKSAKVSNISIIVISSFILAIDIIFNSVVVYSNLRDKIISIIICLYNIVCCLMVLLLQFYVMSLKQSQTDLLITSQLLYNSEEQYKQNKENIELINIKCHDLKHQIERFSQKGSFSQEESKELESMIDIYDTNVKTGNDVLDLIIKEKSLLCQKKNIKLKCYADCSKLNFITETDLYNLFGNALDNSIEAVSKINDYDKRRINLIVKNMMSFVSINIENYFEGHIELDKNGIPKTTKNNVQYHGFGMKSIKLVINKYHGDLKIVTDGDIFSLCILFPLDE